MGGGGMGPGNMGGGMGSGSSVGSKRSIDSDGSGKKETNMATVISALCQFDTQPIQPFHIFRLL